MKDILSVKSDDLKKILGHLASSFEEDRLYELYIKASNCFDKESLGFNNFELAIYLQFYELESLYDFASRSGLDKEFYQNYDYLMKDSICENVYVMHDGINFLIVYYGTQLETLQTLNAEYTTHLIFNYYDKKEEADTKKCCCVSTKLSIKPLKRNFYNFRKNEKSN